LSAKHFHFVTLFPEVIQTWMHTSILGRAAQKGIFESSVYQLRDFATDKYRSVDDVAYGGGGGMVLKVECLVAAIDFIKGKIAPETPRVIYFSPVGTPWSHHHIPRFLAPSMAKHLILVCGHYEGVDQRFVDHWVDEEISLGDFVLTGGELPALAFADSLSRHLEGTLKGPDSFHQESFSLGDTQHPLLEYPHYTRPAEFQGHQVPEVLMSGDHEKISEWRKQESLKRTQAKRPDLLRN